MPIEPTLAPSFIMLAGALLMPLASNRLRSSVALLFPLLSLGLVMMMPPGSHLTFRLMAYQLLICQVDQLSRIFGVIFSLITFIGCLFAFHVRERGQQSAALTYAAGALGVTFAGDFITLLVFWEIMALASTYLIWAGGTRESEKAGMRYLMVHIFGGGLLLAGILIHTAETGSIVIERLAPAGALSSWLILTGIGLNAAFIPLHAWLPDAYPRATVTGAIFLSALTTKTAVYALIRIFPGWEVLIFMGVLMALYGVVFAVLANDIREILSYHIVSQVGYMVAGAGIGTELALNGSAAHAFNNILYKTLLFMAAGAVIQGTGKSKLTELGGLAQRQPMVLGLYMIGVFSISGFPLFNGFISKSMVVAAAGEAHYGEAMLLLTLASVGTFLSVGLKLPYFTWYGIRRRLKPLPLPVNMYLGMGSAALFCILYGILPELLYALLPYKATFDPFTLPHLTETVQILVFTFVAFWILRESLKGEARIILDVDWFYRRPAKWAQRIFTEELEGIFNKVDAWVVDGAGKLAMLGKNPHAIFFRPPAQARYSPDSSRPTLQTLILLVIFSFVIFGFWGLFLR